jgi:hypothetical protein
VFYHTTCYYDAARFDKMATNAGPFTTAGVTVWAHKPDVAKCTNKDERTLLCVLLQQVKFTQIGGK